MAKIITLLFCTVLFNCTSTKPLDYQKIIGFYQSDAPCKDCRGVKTNILLKPDFSFEKTTLYLGNENEFSEIVGTWALDNDSTISLLESGIEKKYRVKNNPILTLYEIGDNSNTKLQKIDEDTKAEGKITSRKANGFDYFAAGNEPFWSFEMIAEKSITFSFIEGSPIVSKDIITSYKNGVQTIKSKSNTPNIEVKIYDFECVDDMSGAISNNYVEVKIDDKLYKGCGNLLNKDFNLSGKWYLKSIKDIELNTKTTDPLPNINFNIQQKTVSGNFGCNNYNGTYTAEKNKIDFSKLVSTLMACPALDTESKFSEALKSSNSYKIVNNKLQLYKGKELLLSFSR